MRVALLAVLAVVLVGHAAAISIKWTGYAGNNQWETNNNWYPNQVPGPNDDVTIDQGVVYLTAPTGVNSLGMGTSFNSPANLTIFSNFYVVQTMTVDGNGNLFINSGAVTITGTINVAGNLFFGAGTLSGQWTIGSRGVATLSSPGLKAFSGCQFIAGGSLTLSGILALNQSSVFTITSSATASGAFAIQAQDSTVVLFDASAGTLTYQGGGDFQIQAPVKLGTFNFVAGNLTLFDSVNFVNSFAIPSGSYVATVGAASVNMTAGVTGPGVLTAEGASIVLGNVNMTGDLNIGGGAASFVSEQNYIAVLSIFGGTTTLTNGVSTGMVNLLSGVLNGPSGIVSVKAYINTAGFNLNAPLHLGGAVSVLGKSILAFGSSGRLTFGSKAVATVSGSLQFTGAPGSPGVTNDGVLNVAGPVSFQNVNLGGSGSCSVGSTLQVSSITFAQNSVSLTANGVFKGSNTLISDIASVSAPSQVYARFGQYQLTCPKECDNVSTNGIPTDTFRFSASSSMAKKH